MLLISNRTIAISGSSVTAYIVFSSSDTDNLLALLSVCKFAKNVHYDQILKYYALLYFFYFLVHIFAQNNCKNIVFCHLYI